MTDIKKLKNLLPGAQLGILRGRGPNQKKGHTLDHFKAVMSCGMSVFFKSEGEGRNQGIFFKCLHLQNISINAVTEDGGV